MAAGLGHEATAQLDLATAFLGSATEAVTYGLKALATPRMVASVHARATTFNTVLTTTYPGTSQAAEFQASLTATHLEGATP